jgi:hypothetical protein
MKHFNLSLFLFSLIITSCEWDAEDDQNKIVRNEPQYQYKQIIFSEQVESGSLAMHAEANDYIKLELSGAKQVPQFTDIYQKTSTSTWITSMCWDDGCPNCKKILRPLKAYRRCRSWSHSGECTYNYRGYEGVQEEVISFQQHSEGLRLHYQIGENLYPLGKVLEHKGSSIVVGFRVTNEMIKDSNEIKFIIKPDPNAQSINIGFMGYEKCAGIGQQKFHSHADTSTEQASSEILVRYIVNLYKREQ